MPLTFVVCVSDTDVLAANLLASPCLAAGSPHEVISVLKAPDAAAGLNLGLDRARNGLVVCVHQDVFLPEGWDRRLEDQWRLACRELGPVGVAGVYGVGEAVESTGRPLAARRIGRVAASCATRLPCRRRGPRSMNCFW